MFPAAYSPMKGIPMQFLDQLGYGGNIIAAALILLAALILWLILRALINRMVKRVQNGYEIIALMTAIEQLGVNIGPILASVGIVGIAIGFGAREVIRDAFLGFFITIEDQYGIGDVIVVGDTVGVVQSVGLRITRMVDENGAIWYIRNGDIMKVGNRTQGNYVPPAADDEKVEKANEQ